VTVRHNLSMTSPDDPAYENKPSNWNEAHVQTITLVGNTNNASTVAGSNIQLSGGANITLIGSNGSIGFSAAAAGGGGTLSVFALGNTTQNSSSSLDARSVSFNGLGIVTVGFSNGSVQLSATQSNQAFTAAGGSSAFQTLGFSDNSAASFTNTNGSVAIASVRASLFALGNTTQNSSTPLNLNVLSLNGLGIVTVGFSNGSIQVSATQSNQGFSAAGGSSAFQTLGFSDNAAASFTNTNGSLAIASVRASLFALGNTTQNSSTPLNLNVLSLNGLGIVTVGFSNGSIQVSATTAQSVQTVGLYALGNTTQNSSTTFDARTISFNGLGIITVGFSNGSVQLSATQSNQAFTAAGGSSAFQTLGFSDNAAASFTNTNGSVAIASVRASLFALGNTTQNSSTALNLNVLSVNGLGIITAGFSNGSIQLSATQSAQTIGLYAVSNTTGASSSSTFDARTVSFQGAGIASVGFSNGSVVISVPSGGGAGDGVVSIGMSTEGNTAGTTGLVSSGRMIVVGSGAISLSQSVNGQSASLSILGPATSSIVGTSGITLSTAGSTISVQPVPMSSWDNLWEVTQAGTAQANSLVSIQPVYLEYPLAASNVLLAASVNVATQTNNSSGYYDISVSGVFYTANSQTLSSLFSFSNSFTNTWSSNNTGTVTGVQGMTASFATTTLTAGQYYLALHVSTNNSATGGANTTALANTLSMVLGRAPGSAVLNLKLLGAQSNNSVGLIPGLGIISTGATRASIAFSDYTVTGTRAALAGVGIGLRNSTWQ
jgi:hypothetical protein